MRLERLTSKEKQFAEENHSLIYKFLNNGNYNIEDYYNIAVFGYLKAVQIYHRIEEKRKYKFSVIAWKYMQAEMGNYFRMETAKKRTTEENILSLDADAEEIDSLYNIVGGKSAEADVMEDAAIQELFNSLTDAQQKIVTLKIEGYNNTEVCELLGMASSTFYKEMKRLQGTIMGNMSR